MRKFGETETDETGTGQDVEGGPSAPDATGGTYTGTGDGDGGDDLKLMDDDGEPHRTRYAEFREQPQTTTVSINPKSDKKPDTSTSLLLRQVPQGTCKILCDSLWLAFKVGMFYAVPTLGLGFLIMYYPKHERNINKLLRAGEEALLADAAVGLIGGMYGVFKGCVKNKDVSEISAFKVATAPFTALAGLCRRNFC